MRRTCLDSIHQLARQDSRIVFVGSDLGAGVLQEMREEMPDRFYMEGVSEANIIGLAAGLAMEGFIPYVNTIATFLTRRCYEQVALDLCLHNLPVRLIGNGGGVVYAPLGPTHLATEDIAIFRALPNMTIISPVDKEEMARFMPHSVDHPGPIYIRLAKGGDPIVSPDDQQFEIGRATTLQPPAEVTFITTGIMTNRAIEAAKMLLEENRIECGILHMHTVKPLDEAAVIEAAQRARLLVTMEEHTRIGGLGSAVAETLFDRNIRDVELLRLGLPDHFAHDYGRQDTLLEEMGLGIETILGSIRQRI